MAPLGLAHHSTAPYDLIHGTTVEGVVTRFAWENPHAHVYLDVKADGGSVQRWSIEIDGPGVLRRLGWTKDILKPGDLISVTGARAKDGSFHLKAMTIQLSDGRKLQAVPKIEN